MSTGRTPYAKGSANISLGLPAFRIFPGAPTRQGYGAMDPLLASNAPGFRLVEDILASGRTMNLFFFELENFFAFRSLYGDQFTRQILDKAREDLEAIAGETLGECENRAIEPLEAGQFLLLCGSREACESGCASVDQSELALSMRLKFKTSLKKAASHLTGQSFDVLVGYAVLTRYGSLGPEASLYNALCDAQRAARGQVSKEKQGALKEFREILDKPRIKSHYQPIVNLQSGEIMAWEALSRGPEDSLFHLPTTLFDYAEDVGEIFALEKICREMAIRHFGEANRNQKLFLNIHPKTLVDPAFCPRGTLALLHEHGLAPENIVFEITERHAIRDFTLFHDVLSQYRAQGYQVAVDDVGTGYSGLWSIAEIRPDFIKIDMSFIRGIDTNPVKRALVETFVAFSERIGCRIIAEGIETATELSSLVSMGAHFGQGYYLARPAFPKPGVNLKRPTWNANGKRTLTETKCLIPVRELAESACSIPPDAMVSDVKNVLRGEESICAVAVTRDESPVGLIMSHHLDRALSSQYGMSLYYHRSVTRIMDPQPLVVEGDTPVETAARRAMNRDRAKIYDHILVTEQGKLSGIVSVQKMLDTLAAVQVEMAKGANPLTGLPGNLAIEREIEARTALGVGFTIIYADLDNFKVYNDVYGFKNGDNILLLLAKILTWAVRRHGGEGDFTGHVGGDDFVVLTSLDKAERICLAVTRVFERLARYHYSPEDREHGVISGKDRHGVEREFPLVTVSLALVDCLGKCTLAAIARRSAEMKTFAKKLSGNCFVRDRRGPLQPECACPNPYESHDPLT